MTARPSAPPSAAGRRDDVGGEAGEGGADLGEVVGTGEVARRDAQVLELLPPDQPLGGRVVDRRTAIEVGEHVDRVIGGRGAPRDRRRQQAGERPAGRHHRHEPLDQLRVGHEPVGEIGV